MGDGKLRDGGRAAPFYLQNVPFNILLIKLCYA